MRWRRASIRASGEAAAAVPPAKSPPAAAAAPAVTAAAAVPPHLADLLAAHKAETDTDSAFTKLFSLWGAKYQASTTDPCTQAAQQGLECVSERGSFGQLRLYNHPAILLLNDSGGASHQVVLTSLGDDEARLELGGPQRVRNRRPVALLARGLRDAMAPGELPGEGTVGRHARRSGTLATPEPAAPARQPGGCARQ